MIGILYFLIALQLLGAFLYIAMIGKPRQVITPTTAGVNVVLSILLILFYLSVIERL